MRTYDYATNKSPYAQCFFNFSLSCFCVPGNAAGMKYLTNVLQQTLASREVSIIEGLFPSADRRSSPVRSLGATRSRRGPVDRRASPIPRESILDQGRPPPSLLNEAVVQRRPLLVCADDAAGTAPASADRTRLLAVGPATRKVPQPACPHARKSPPCRLFHIPSRNIAADTPWHARIYPMP